MIWTEYFLIISGMGSSRVNQSEFNAIYVSLRWLTESRNEMINMRMFWIRALRACVLVKGWMFCPSILMNVSVRKGYKCDMREMCENNYCHHNISLPLLFQFPAKCFPKLILQYNWLYPPIIFHSSYSQSKHIHL